MRRAGSGGNTTCRWNGRTTYIPCYNLRTRSCGRLPVTGSGSYSIGLPTITGSAKWFGYWRVAVARRQGPAEQDASDQVFAAVVRLVARELHPFTEWDLSVEVWRTLPHRFGMPGYTHPDHKRCYVEVIRLLDDKLLERTVANTFKLTANGWAKLKGMR
jgi:hypothetical protein